MFQLDDLNAIIQDLARQRPIFHSEADFQHALAWRIHEKYAKENAMMRLEVNPYKDGRRDYIDILVGLNDDPIAMELKYKTSKLDITVGDEDFHLLDQSAQDIGRYDFIKDISRLERFVLTSPQALGFAIFLTNDQTYWQQTKRHATVDNQFRIHENAILKGGLQWSELASAGTRRGREKELALTGEYPLIWQEYSKLTDKSGGQFRYLLLVVRNRQSIKS